MTPDQFAEWAFVVVGAFAGLGIAYQIFWKDGP
jgi:hypothetical protein